jgi:hypothetical protein
MASMITNRLCGLTIRRQLSHANLGPCYSRVMPTINVSIFPDKAVYTNRSSVPSLDFGSICHNEHASMLSKYTFIEKFVSCNYASGALVAVRDQVDVGMFASGL